MKAALAYMYGTFNISRQLMKASKTGGHSFIRTIDELVMGVAEAQKQELNFSFWGDGSGSLSKITQASGAVTAGVLFTVDDASKLEPGMVIDTFAAKTGGTASLDSKIIDQVDVLNNKISLTTTETVSQNHLIFREDSRGQYGMGLVGLVDGADSQGNRILATVQNVTRSSNLWADAGVLDNNGSNRSLTVKLVQQAFEVPEILIGKTPSAIYSNYGVRRAYFDLLQADKRYVNMMKLDGGFSALEYTGGKDPIPWIADRHAPKNQAFFVHEPELCIYSATNGIEWIDEDGSILDRAADDSFSARSAWYGTLASHLFKSSAVLRDISE